MWAESRNALCGSAEPNLWVSGHRGEWEQWQISAEILYSGYPGQLPSLVYGQSPGESLTRMVTRKLSVAWEEWTWAEPQELHVASVSPSCFSEVGESYHTHTHQKRMYKNPSPIITWRERSSVSPNTVDVSSHTPEFNTCKVNQTGSIFWIL